MTKKKVVLTFPKQLIGKPIIFNLVKDYDLVPNILRAQVMPDEEGKMVVELEGARADIEKGLEFLGSLGVSLELLGRDIRLDSGRCVNCGACAAVCMPKALTLNPETWELEFDRSKCVLCGLCESACPVKAVSVTF